MRWVCLGVMLMCAMGAAEETAWERGRVREQLMGGLPTDAAALDAWAAAGLTSAAGVPPELAHAHKLRTRGWFTLDYMDSRRFDRAAIEARAARTEDGGFLRPNDPLFPEVGQYAWSACINNPLWIETARNVFRGLATSGFDGVHVDYASHYEPCFCQHCKARWTTYAAQCGVDPDLTKAAHAPDARTGLLLTEFRIRNVMDFLADLRATARAIKPGFGLDGTWHQDPGSLYQWAYGDHFDLMCIEGTTHGPFPPVGTQLVWLKVAHALSEKPDRRPVAMSVTYHLLNDDQGNLHHGRMAPDRLRVAMAEIVSQGAVSWLGLGGPGTGNLIREHVDTVRAYDRLARDLEPLLSAETEVAELGVLVSPRSYLAASGLRQQVFAFGHALLKGHVPFRILSDARLRAEDLRGLSGVVLPAAPALSDAAIAALSSYIEGGGRLLVLGSDAATLDGTWRERAQRPAFAVAPEGKEPFRERRLGRGLVRYWVEDAFGGRALGASQSVTLDPAKPVTYAIEGWSKAEGVGGQPDSDYSLYVDLTHADGTPLWGQVGTFDTGTHDWQFRRKLITSDKPFKAANVHLLFRRHGGTAWFRDVHFGVWDPQQQRIVKDLLVPSFTLPDGKTVRAAGTPANLPGWSPYGEGYEVENQFENGLWVKVSGGRAVSLGNLSDPAGASEAQVLDAVAPLRGQPTVVLEGDGADRVSVDVERAGDRLLIHLINHRAELHPDKPELEQQRTEKSIAARHLVLRLRPAGLKLDATGAKALAAEGTPAAKFAADGDGLRVELDELAQYVAVVCGVK